jgi:hypothetical protein
MLHHHADIDATQIGPVTENVAKSYTRAGSLEPARAPLTQKCEKSMHDGLSSA